MTNLSLLNVKKYDFFKEEKVSTFDINLDWCILRKYGSDFN